MNVGADLLPRVASALVLAPVVLAAALWGGWPFSLLVAVAAMLVLWEWMTMIRVQPRIALLGIGGGALLAALLALQAGHPWLAPAAIVLGAAVVAAVASGEGAARVWALAGVLYAAGVMLPATVLRADAALGMVSLAWLFAVVWGTDIAAYFCGRLIGGPKLWPRVSPNKTWSGALGGCTFATLGGMLVVWAAGLDSALLAAPAAFAASIASQGGDLFESAMKRRFGVKDSSRLIPGHGGLMDRLDGFIIAAFIALAIGLLRNPAAPAQGLLLW